MNSKRDRSLAIMLLLLASVSVQAMIIGAGRFDQLIKNAEIIVKAQIIWIDNPSSEMFAFEAAVITVLKSDGTILPAQLDLEAPTGIWPRDLGIPFLESQVVLLVLKRVDGKMAVVNNLRAILPATNNKILHDDHSSVVRKVFNELHVFLPQAEGKLAKGFILVHLSQLASKSDEKIFLPYMKSENEWLRRAALASLLWVNATPKRIEAAIADFDNHISKPSRLVDYSYPKDYLFWKMYEGVRWAARCGSFGMEKELTARAKAYLPIYRNLIDKAPPNYKYVHIAIEALKNVGTKEDIRRLYKHVDHKKAWIRHDVLEGLGRILDMKIERPLITSYEMPLPPDVKSWEKKMRSIIEQTLVDEDLLEK